MVLQKKGIEKMDSQIKKELERSKSKDKKNGIKHTAIF